VSHTGVGLRQGGQGVLVSGVDAVERRLLGHQRALRHTGPGCLIAVARNQGVERGSSLGLTPASDLSLP
jgi:hypothetical protein